MERKSLNQVLGVRGKVRWRNERNSAPTELFSSPVIAPSLVWSIFHVLAQSYNRQWHLKSVVTLPDCRLHQDACRNENTPSMSPVIVTGKEV